MKPHYGRYEVRATMMTRLYRRVILKHFGGTRNFLVWSVAVILTIYVLDTYILTQDRFNNLLGGQRDIETTKSSTKETEKKPEAELSKKPPPKEIIKTPDKPAKAKKRPQVILKKKKRKPVLKCNLKEECPAGKYAYYVKSGTGKDIPPTICFDGNYAMTPEKKNGHRGINIVVVNDKTKKVESVRYFDTYTEDTSLVRFLKLGITDQFVILAATQDEATTNLKEDGKKWLYNFGSSMVTRLKFRDSFAMVGQRGLTRGSAIEKVGLRDKREFADPVEITGCLSIPVGKLSKIQITKDDTADKTDMKTGEELPNCGVKSPCGEDSFSAHLYTGQGNSEGPKICVNGKYVLAKGLNDGGRGINLAIVDPKAKDTIRVGHFDTYAEDSSNLEIFLEMMNEGEIVLAVTHDDASKKISEHVKQLLGHLGSGMIQNVKFRDVWMFVGQKGIKGFAQVEQIEFAGPTSQWPKPIDKKICVPTQIKGTKIKPDPLANKNEKRRKFCAKYDGYGEFCETIHIDEVLTPAPLTDKSLENHAIFQVPIIVIPGLNHNAVRMQLETLLMNPGFKTEMVTVMCDEKFDEPAALAELFNFKAEKLESSTKYALQVEKALVKVWDLHPKAKHVIVLEEEVIVGPDFLYFLAQCLPTLEGDSSLIGISAWNENGYKGVSTLSTLAYRTETFPGLGFLVKRSFYEEQMKGKMKACCLERSWNGWFTGKLDGKEMIVPDVSRVYRRPYEGLSDQADFLTELFNRDRVTNMIPKAKLSNVSELSQTNYEKSVMTLLKTATALDTSSARDCMIGKGRGFYIPSTAGKTYAVFYEQKKAGDYDILSRLCRCFGLFHDEDHPPRGLHRGLIRFTYEEKVIMFVGSSTPYYKWMPENYKPVTHSLL